MSQIYLKSWEEGPGQQLAQLSKEVAKLKKPEYGFGMHLILDGYGCDRQRLEDISLIYNFLSEYPAQIKMTKIMPPYVFRYEAENPQDWGISGFVLIAESHISIHTFPEKNYFSLDIFSCKNFDSEQAISYVSNLFATQKSEIKLLDRGLEFPKDIRSSAHIVQADRHRLDH
jgi:S-adenosylmethionine decarboxylase